MIQTAQPQVQLAATLAMPEARAPTHVVVMLPVAGPADRDLSLGPRGIYQQAASLLVAKGIASLRLASRGVYGSGGDWLETDFEMRLADASAAVDMLLKHAVLSDVPLGLIGMWEAMIDWISAH